MKVKSESEVTQLCLTLSDPLDCSLPGSSVHGIFQARVLEWVVTAFSEKLGLRYSNYAKIAICKMVCIYLRERAGEGEGRKDVSMCMDPGV